MSWGEIRRALFPRLRRPEPVGIVRNGATKRVYGCALCHEEISMNAKWPVPVRVWRFRAEHNDPAHVFAFLVSRALASVAR